MVVKTEHIQAALKRHGDALKRQQLLSGNPSYRTIAKRTWRDPSTQAPLSVSTVFRMVNGVHKPAWPSVESFLRALRVPEEEIKTVWLTRWVKLMDEIGGATDDSISQYPAEEGAAEAAAGVECPVCGAWVTNPDLHEAWHRRDEPGSARRLRAV